MTKTDLDNLTYEQLGLNPMRSRLLSAGEIMSMEPTKDLIDGVLSESSLAILYGKYGSGKSFVALDWALCIANGLPWQNRVVKEGPILYALAEGTSGMRERVSAWCQYVGYDAPEGAWFLPEPINLLSETSVSQAADLVKSEGIRLVVIDTLNQSIVGGDENSSVHMGTAVASAKALQRATKATVLIVHHTGHSGELRGHTSLPAAADHIIYVWSPPEGHEAFGTGLIGLYSKKVKEGPRFEPIYLKLKRVDVPGSRDGSCVVISS